MRKYDRLFWLTYGNTEDIEGLKKENEKLFQTLANVEKGLSKLISELQSNHYVSPKFQYHTQAEIDKAVSNFMTKFIEDTEV